jgi:hypothetical protein
LRRSGFWGAPYLIPAFQVDNIVEEYVPAPEKNRHICRFGVQDEEALLEQIDPVHP